MPTGQTIYLSATDKVLGRSTAGAGAAEEIACTAAGRSVLAAATATAIKTYLGIGGSTFTQIDNTAGRVEFGQNNAYGSITLKTLANATAFQIYNAAHNYIDNVSGVNLNINYGGATRWTFLNAGGVLMADGNNLTFGTTTGSKLGGGPTEKMGRWGSTPIVRPSFIVAPTGGATIDAEARTAIDAIRALLVSIGDMAAA